MTLTIASSRVGCVLSLRQVWGREVSRGPGRSEAFGCEARLLTETIVKFLFVCFKSKNPKVTIILSAGKKLSHLEKISLSKYHNGHYILFSNFRIISVSEIGRG